MNSEHVWKDNSVQFPRLLAEIYAVGLTGKQEKDLQKSMDITREDLYDLLERADQEFERLKRRGAPKRKCDLSKATETMAFYKIHGQVKVDIGWIGEGSSGDYNPEDPNDEPLLRFTVTDLTKRARDSQDNSLCTSINAVLPKPMLIDVCRHIAECIVSEEHWKRMLESKSWLNSDDARHIHDLYEGRKKNGRA
jgi:hypothetical protein